MIGSQSNSKGKWTVIPQECAICLHKWSLLNRFKPSCMHLFCFNSPTKTLVKLNKFWDKDESIWSISVAHFWLSELKECHNPIENWYLKKGYYLFLLKKALNSTSYDHKQNCTALDQQSLKSSTLFTPQRRNSPLPPLTGFQRHNAS